MDKKQSPSLWEQVLASEAATKKAIAEVKKVFEAKVDELEKELKKEISKHTKEYAKTTFPLLAKYKEKGSKLSASKNQRESLHGFLLLLLISENLFFREKNELRTNEKSVVVKRSFSQKGVTFTLLEEDRGDESIFKIVGTFETLFGAARTPFQVTGSYFSDAHGEGPDRDGGYTKPEAMNRVLSILKFHFHSPKRKK